MNILRRRVRSAFRWGAVSFIAIFILGLARPEFADTYGSTIYYLVLAGSALLGVLYGAAWLTTRKPSPYRNNWAVAASSLSLIWGVVMACAIYRFMPDNLRAEIGALITIAIGGAGLYLYVPGGSPSNPDSATQTAAPAKPQAPVPTPQPSVRRPSSAPTAIAPSMAAVTASSPELATAAAAPAAPGETWDPLQFMRSPETLQKLRG